MATRDSLVQKAIRILGVTASYNASVEEAVDDAMAYLVRNYSFDKAIRYVEINVVAGSRLVLLPADVRRIRFVRLLLGGRGYPIDGGSPDTFPVQNYGVPRKYWRDNQNQLFLDTIFPADGMMELRYYSKTGAGTTTGGAENPASTWLPEDYPEAVLQRALITVAPECRKPEVTQMYLPLWQDTVQQLTVQQHEDEYANTSATMTYQQKDSPGGIPA